MRELMKRARRSLFGRASAWDILAALLLSGLAADGAFARGARYAAWWARHDHPLVGTFALLVPVVLLALCSVWLFERIFENGEGRASRSASHHDAQCVTQRSGTIQ